MGLVAGWGRYPIVVAEALRRQGCRIVTLGIKNHADPDLRTISDEYKEVGLGKVGAAMRFFRQHDVRAATMAGKIHKVRLFQRFYLLKHLPDWQGLRLFFPHFLAHTQDRKDDTLLGAVTQAFSKIGITFAPATDFVPEVLVKAGTLSRRQPSSTELQDIRFGWKLAKEIGRMDIGQCVVVKGQAILAVEAIEGTDLCIRRAGELCPAGGFTVVKVAKPQQDMRFDVPTIGIGTMKSMAAAGGRVLAIEASKTILIDEPDVIEFANQHDISVISFSADCFE
jgi:UDP-2,3-diacylglucosamine hydrolase